MSQNRKASKADVMIGVKIVDLAEEFGIILEKISSGGFDYRCKCPSKDHKNGNERTNSCYVNSKDNDFHCYGCLAHGNCLDFYMLCAQVSFGEAFVSLRERVEPGINNQVQSYEFDNFYILLEISKLCYQTMIEHPEDLKWIRKLAQSVDRYTLNLEPEDHQAAKKLLKKVKKFIEKRYGV